MTQIDVRPASICLKAGRPASRASASSPRNLSACTSTSAGKFIGERGDRGIVVRRLVQAAAAQLAARRRQRAARAARRGEARQVGVAGGAEQLRGRAAAEKAAAAEQHAREEFAHAIFAPMWTVAQLAADLAAGRTTSRRADRAGARAHRRSRRAKAAGRSSRCTPTSALADADSSDRLRKSGVRRSPVDGLPVSLKDLFDVAGDVTRAGSRSSREFTGKDRCARGRAPARGGRGVRRPHQHGGVRLRRRRPQPALRHAEESVGPQDRAACRAARPPARRWRRPTACA